MKTNFKATIILFATAVVAVQAAATAISPREAELRRRQGHIAECSRELIAFNALSTSRDHDTSLNIGEDLSHVTISEGKSGDTVIYRSNATSRVNTQGFCEATPFVGLDQGVIKAIENLDRRNGVVNSNLHNTTMIKIACEKAFPDIANRWPEVFRNEGASGSVLPNYPQTNGSNTPANR